MKNDVFTLITQRTAKHLGVTYVVVQSDECIKNIVVLKDKMLEIENFVKDTTHELNTPITALMMSTSRIKSKKHYDEKIVNNISISTKQLYDIYASLSYLSFDHDSEESQEIAFEDTVDESIEYFQELLNKKGITLVKELKTLQLPLL